MAIEEQPAKQRRPLGLSLLGVMLLTAGAFVAYNGYQIQAHTVTTASYAYTVKQSASAEVNYFDSSFFGQAPAPVNNAYVASLTDTIKARFSYNFTANQSANITYTYSAKAQIKANYSLKGNADESSNVWVQDYPLIAPVTKTASGTAITETQQVSIPYAEYQKTSNNFRNTLALPSNGEAVITFTMQVSGSTDGTPFTDDRTSTVSVPLDQQIYQPAVKFDKEETKTVVSQNAKQGQDRTSKIQLIGGSVAALGGLALMVYGLRKRIFKSAYQRQLDKIYRYHDGIIVRTSRPINLEDHRIIPMRTFEDMLNLEEELKTPIIADEISSTNTNFMIAHDGAMYLYKLSSESDNRASHVSRLTQQATATRPVEAPPIQATAAPQVHTYGLATALNPARNTTDGMIAKRPLGSHTVRKTTTPPALEASMDEIISELTKKPERPAKKPAKKSPKV